MDWCLGVTPGVTCGIEITVLQVHPDFGKSALLSTLHFKCIFKVQRGV